MIIVPYGLKRHNHMQCYHSNPSASDVELLKTERGESGGYVEPNFPPPQLFSGTSFRSFVQFSPSIPLWLFAIYPGSK